MDNRIKNEINKWSILGFTWLLFCKSNFNNNKINKNGRTFLKL